MGDAVRDALDRAAEAAWLARHPGGDWKARQSWLNVPAAKRRPSVDPDNYEDHSDLDEARAVSAAAIAAFLRALPDRFPMPSANNPACQVWGHASGEMARLAAAVERAGQEGR